jgi:poly(3-hydroxyalkanoate) synthetase
MNKMVPALDTEINEVFDKSKDKKYLDGDNMDNMFEIINELDAIENHFK